MNNRIPDQHQRDVCKPGTLECCRYITAGAAGLYCEKHTSLKSIIDARVAENSFRAVGDNCEGLK